MALDLSLSNDEERALAKLLRRAIDDDDRFPLSPRVQMWQAILDKIEPPPLREPLPPPSGLCWNAIDHRAPCELRGH
jgi:hypothetical protein